MKVVAIVPMKMNNERLPGKNIKKFYDGTPLCDLVFNTISSLKNIDEAYCFCSDESIREFLPERINYLKRSKDLDTQSATMNDVIKSFISKVDSEIYVLTHVTSPFIKTSTISACIDAVRSGRHDSALSVEALHDFLWLDGKPLNYDPEKIARTQDLPTIFRESSGVYVFTKELFEKHSRRVGFTPYLHEVGFVEGIDIDYSEDFDVSNAIYRDIMQKHHFDCR